MGDQIPLFELPGQPAEIEPERRPRRAARRPLAILPPMLPGFVRRHETPAARATVAARLAMLRGGAAGLADWLATREIERRGNEAEWVARRLALVHRERDRARLDLVASLKRLWARHPDTEGAIINDWGRPVIIEQWRHGRIGVWIRSAEGHRFFTSPERMAECLDRRWVALNGPGGKQ